MCKSADIVGLIAIGSYYCDEKASDDHAFPFCSLGVACLISAGGNRIRTQTWISITSIGESFLQDSEKKTIGVCVFR